MPKPKNTELNFLYENEKTKKNKERTKKKVNKEKRADKKSAQDETFDFDNEIVIGVTIPKEENKKKHGKAHNKKSKNKKVSNNQKDRIKAENKKTKKKEIKNKEKKAKENLEQSEKIKRPSNFRAFVKWIILIIALIIALLFFLMSPLFNLSQIDVVNNQKLSRETIISLSNLEIGQNVFKTMKAKIRKNIKENAYVEEVAIKRKLPNTIEISIKERKASYMIEFANSYAYINNQGYILEVSETKIEVPIIVGYTTKEEDIKPGSRLSENDLERLQMVLKITEIANSNGIGNYITRINIENKQNYTLIMDEKKKTIYLGDATNLSNKMLYLKAILTDEEGVEGEIFLNVDLDKENAFFRKKE